MNSAAEKKMYLHRLAFSESFLWRGRDRRDIYLFFSFFDIERVSRKEEGGVGRGWGNQERFESMSWSCPRLTIFVQEGRDPKLRKG